MLWVCFNALTIIRYSKKHQNVLKIEDKKKKKTNKFLGVRIIELTWSLEQEGSQHAFHVCQYVSNCVYAELPHVLLISLQMCTDLLISYL